MADLHIGVMSGTSVDGIDAVLVRFNPNFQILGHRHQAWPEALARGLRSLALGQEESIDSLGAIDQQAADQFALCINGLLKSQEIPAGQVAAVGCHGQTVRHRPTGEHPFTLQVGDPNRVAELTGITVVADFRRRDMAAGGQGAPLVPAFHQAQFRSNLEDRAILNLGGIANLTLLPADEEAPVTGMDCGPANTLMDAWYRKHHGSGRYDSQGSWAATGAASQELLRNLLSEPYFHLPAPKSTGPELFNLDWLGQHLTRFPGLAARDVQATLLELTVEAVALCLQQSGFCPGRLIVCGGGAANTQLMKRLETRLPDATLESSAEHNLDPQLVEACAFAWLASQTIQGLPGNLPTVTGARGERILGAIYPA